MKKILLLGGEGYIGNVVSKHLLHKGYSVTSFDSLLYSNMRCVEEKLNHSNYEFIKGDINNKSQLLDALTSSDSVILLAGLVGDPITKNYPKEASVINDVGVQKVIKTCASENTDRFIFISTCSNYGLIEGEQKADENFELNPLSLYAKSKVSAEKLILSQEGRSNFCPTILRFATAFGLSPRMRFDLTVNEFTRELAIGNELLVFDADTWRPYCHVQDFARLIEIVLKAPKEKICFKVFNAGGDANNSTKRMIIETILKLVPNGKVNFQKKPGEDPRNYIVDFSKVKKILDFTPEFSIEMGISEIIEATNRNRFDRVLEDRNFYGNYEVNL